MATLPSLQISCDINVKPGIFGDITFPKLGLSGSITIPTELSGSVILPGLEVEGDLNWSINGDIVLPSLELNGAIGWGVSGNLTLPLFEMNGEINWNINSSITLPAFQTTGTLCTPAILAGDINLQSFESNGTLYIPVELSGVITLPSFELSASVTRELLTDLWGTRPRNEIYTCTISAGGYDDVALPISSWQARFRTDDAQSYVAVVVPGIDYWEEIFDRAAGTITIAKGWKFLDTNEIFTTDIIVADIDSISNDEGSKSASIGITAYTILTEVPKNVTITEVIYRGVTTAGKNKWRMPLYLDIDSISGDFFIKPGDTITYDGDSITADYISITTNTTQEIMEITST